MKNNYPSKKQILTWNDIRSGHKPQGNRMLYILVGGDIFIGGYSRYEKTPNHTGEFEFPHDGKMHFWDGQEENEIPDDEVTAWAYMNAPDFEE